jgi:beta-lactamase regulating signal transducer with metallopeptidase domain
MPEIDLDLTRIKIEEMLVCIVIGIIIGMMISAYLLVEAQAQSVQMSASVELTEANAFSTCVQEQCGHLK